MSVKFTRASPGLSFFFITAFSAKSAEALFSSIQLLSNRIAYVA